MLENIELGIDLAKISDFKNKPYSNFKSFYENLFSKEEIDYCLSYVEPYEHFTGKFAIKEAVIKTVNEKVHMSQIITSSENSKPSVKIKGKTNFSFKVSLSHEGDFAIAMVLLEKL